jgi:hypothetical protein
MARATCRSGETWRSGFSAKALAHCWQEADGFPESVGNALDGSETFLAAQMILAELAARHWRPGGASQRW